MNESIYSPAELKEIVTKYPCHFSQLKETQETLQHIKDLYTDIAAQPERAYMYINELLEKPKCECGCDKKWSGSISRGYGECSDIKCKFRKHRILESRKATNVERHGVEFLLQSEAAKEKYKSTSLRHHGTSNPMQSQEVKDKLKETNLERYGVEYTGGIKEFREKGKTTSLARYGVENPAQSEEIKSKIKSVLFERHGVENPGQIESVKEQVKATNLERYGVEYPSQSSVFKDKAKATNVDRYGVEHPAQLESVKLKARTSSWFSYYDKNKDVLKFRPLDESTRPEFGDLVQCKSCGEESAYRGTPIHWRCPHCEPITSGSSRPELEVLDYIKSIYDGEVIHGDRAVLKPKELDIYVPEKNFAIEFNGTYFHSADEESDKEMAAYHLNKTKGCESQGINLMHIWEYDWNNVLKQKIIKSMIRSKLGLGKRIYARETEVREVSSVVTKQFLSMNHLQGESVSKVNLGLYHNKDLIAIMTFGKPRFNKNYEWELIRYCSLLETNVVGGASKLIKHFRKNYPGSILSYANREHSTGKLYEALGFSLINVAQPNYQWWKGNALLKRYATQKHKLPKLLNESFDLSKTESENMFSNEYRRIWDCGNLVYELS
jgi:hypothetical protein